MLSKLRKLLKKDEGFTLVEVIIVLAIVGLIFVIIFLAVVAAQRGQRDTARKDDVHRLVAAALQYAGNNNGTNFVPAACASPCTTGGPTSSGYILNSPPDNITATAAAPTLALKNVQWYAPAAAGIDCAAGTTKYAIVVVALEGGGTYCKDY